MNTTRAFISKIRALLCRVDLLLPSLVLFTKRANIEPKGSFFKGAHETKGIGHALLLDY